MSAAGSPVSAASVWLTRVCAATASVPASPDPPLRALPTRPPSAAPPWPLLLFAEWGRLLRSALAHTLADEAHSYFSSAQLRGRRKVQSLLLPAQ